MDWFLEKLIELLLLFPRWFGKKLTEYKENDNIAGIILVFIISLAGLFMFALLIVLIAYLIIAFINAHPYIAAIIGSIICLYAYALAKPSSSQNEENTTDNDAAWHAYYEQCDRAYITMRSIMYQTLRGCAMELGCNIPTYINNIEMPEEHYVIANNLCMYQFKLDKAEMHEIIPEKILDEYKEQSQYCLHNKIKNGDFPTLAIEDFVDCYGNVWDGVVIDSISDFGKYLHFYVVFVTAEYTDYIAKRRAESAGTTSTSSNITEKWGK